MLGFMVQSTQDPAQLQEAFTPLLLPPGQDWEMSPQKSLGALQEGRGASGTWDEGQRGQF